MDDIGRGRSLGDVVALVRGRTPAPLEVAGAVLVGSVALDIAAVGRPEVVTPVGMSVAALLALFAVWRVTGTSARWAGSVADAVAVALVAALPRWWQGSSPNGVRVVTLEAVLALLAALTLLTALFVALPLLNADDQQRALRRRVALGLLGCLGAAAALRLLEPEGALAAVPGVLVAAVAGGWLVGSRRAGSAPVAAGAAAAAQPVPRWRVGLLTLLGAAAPLSLLVGTDPVGTVDVLTVTAACALLCVCTSAHVAWWARSLSGLLRERTSATRQLDTLVAVGQGLLQAQDRASACRAGARGAVQLLTAAGATHVAAAVAVGSADLLELVAVDSTGLSLDATVAVDLAALTDQDREALRRGHVVVRSSALPARAGGGLRRDGAGLGGEAASLLVLPLHGAAGLLGAVLLAAPCPDVQQARGTLEAFAQQIALSLETLVRDDPSTSAVTTPGTLDRITEGLREQQFLCHYQPIVDMADGTVAGFEALARWDHPERGLLAPAAFMPAVRDAGLLTALDNMLLWQACAAAVRMDRSGSGPYVSVNLSVGQLTDQQFSQTVQGALLATGLAPWRLQLEVTEASSLTEPELTAQTLRRLRALRVRVAFDDFGTGQSSLAWLHQLPLDVVKIDKSFVDGLPGPPEAPPVVAAVSALAQVLGLGVVAEGVETAAQRDELLRVGVRYAQGWLYARALPEEEAGRYLRERTGRIGDLPTQLRGLPIALARP